MSEEALNLRWLGWWQHGFWLQADQGWHTGRFATLDDELQQRFLHQHASRLQQALEIPPLPLCAAEPMILAIGDLAPDDRQRLLDLVAEICGCATPLSSELKIWCRRLAKGVRPHSWLPSLLFADGQRDDSLLLLQALYPSLWPRLRLLFPPSQAGTALSLPAARLRPLWQAALWQTQQQAIIENQPGETYVES